MADDRGGERGRRSGLSVGELATGGVNPPRRPVPGGPAAPLTLTLLLAALSLLVAAGLGVAVPPTLLAVAALLGALVGGWDLQRRALLDLVRGRSGPDLMVALAVLAGLFAGLLHWLEAGAAAGPTLALYALALVAMVRARDWLQPTGLTPRPAVPASDLPDLVRRARDGEAIPPAEAGPGTALRVSAGEVLGGYGQVAAGAIEVDYGAVTGNPVPRTHQRGWPVLKGGRVLSGAAEIVVADGPDLSLAPDGGEEEPDPTAAERDGFRARLQLSLGIAVGLGWAAMADLIGGSPGRAFLSAVALSAPFSLILVRSVSQILFLRRAKGFGARIHDLSLLDPADRLRHCLLSWHGVCTPGRATVGPVHAVEGSEAELLALAAAVVPKDGHALGPALTAAAEAAGQEVPSATDRSGLEVARGYAGTVGERRILVGNPSLLAHHGVGYQRLGEAAQRLSEEGGTLYWVAEAAPRKRPLGILALADRPRGAVLLRARAQLGRVPDLQILAPEPVTELKPYLSQLKGLPVLQGDPTARLAQLEALKRRGTVAVLAAAPLDAAVFRAGDMRLAPADAPPALLRHAQASLSRADGDRLVRFAQWLRLFSQLRDRLVTLTLAGQLLILLLGPADWVPALVLVLAGAVLSGAAALFLAVSEPESPG